jgi:hypothetical protein
VQWNQTSALFSMADIMDMRPEDFDFYFPFVVFFYGFLLVLVHESPMFSRLGETHLGPLWQNIRSRRFFSWICFFFGGLWSLQNLWI